MTAFEHYQAIANYITDEWTATPVYMLGEVIDIEPPYIVLKAFGIANKSTMGGNEREDVKGFSIATYSANRGLNESMMSDLLDAFTMVNANGIVIEDITQMGGIDKLEDNLFEGSLSFATRNFTTKG